MYPATSAGQSEPQPGAAQRRIVLSFCATVLVGVLLSAGYLVKGSGRVAPPATGKPPVSLPVIAPLRAAAIEPPARIEAIEKKPAAREPKPTTIGPTYLQMAAVDRGVAEVYLEVLRRKGFQALIANGPTADVFRVLVGPVTDASSLARVKADLQAEGFTSFPRKLASE